MYRQGTFVSYKRKMEVKEFIEKNLENMKADLKDLVSYNSVLSDDQQPFGSVNRKVLDRALQIMNDKGLKTENVDYYCGYGEVGQGDKLIGILAHLDVVSAGKGWDSDPFDMVEKDGILYGRGVSDDKGGAVASMYALKYLLEENYPFKKRVRLILGCNEENGSACIAYYVKKHGHIDCGFTPDGEFPGIYAEKGMIDAKVIGHNTKIIDIEGGTVRNAVCKQVIVKLPLNSFDETKFDAFLKEHKVDYTIDKSDIIRLTVNGQAAHASTPELGVNAFSYAMEALYAADFNDSFTTWFHKYFALTLNGEILGYKEIEDDITNTTINFGVCEKVGNDITCTLDMRFPVKADASKVRALLEKAEEEENEIAIYGIVEPLYFDPNSPMITALKDAYVSVTGDTKSQMEAIGGGTYAKEIHNCIAFGCQFLDESNHIHDVNEQLSIESFKKQVELYVQAIKNLNEI